MIINCRPELVAGSRAVTTAFCTAVVLLFWPQQSTLAQVPTGPTQNVLAGSRVFGAKGCARCHAINGLGGAVGPDLGRFPATRSYYDFAAAMWNHLPGMVEQMRELGIERPRLSAWEIGDMIAFLFWLDYFDPPGDVDTGRRVFSEKGCVACHQAGGVGGVEGPALDFLNQYGTPIQVAAALWNHGPAMAVAMQRKGITRPAFTGSELTDLIAFLESASPGIPEGPLYVLPGRTDEGRNLFMNKGCIQCHGVQGQGRRLAPDLAARGRQWSLIEFAAAMWNKEPVMTSAMVERGISVPQLRAGEMADVVAYLSSIQYFGESGNPARGQRRIQARGCLDCHSLYGRGGPAGDLARTEGFDSPAAVIAAMWNHILLTESQPDSVTWPTLQPVEMADLAAFFQASEGNR